MSSLTRGLLLLLGSSVLVDARGEDTLGYADNQAPLNRDSPQVAANFPEVVEGIELLSPAFVSPKSVPEGFANGTSGPTSQWEMDYFLQSLAARHDWMTYNIPDFQSEEGRTIPYVYLSSTSSGDSVLETSVNKTSSQKLRIWMQGGVHGNEPAGDQTLLALLGKMDANVTWAQSILDKADILILPRYNPDGVAYFQRYLATSFDPNRDHTKMARQQTRDIKGLVMDFAPHVGVDIHEYTASRGYGASKQWLPAQDGQFSAMKNLNIHADIRDLSHTLFTDSIAAAMESHDLRWSPYIVGVLGTDDIVLTETSGDAKVGDTSVGLSQAVMFLFETRGIELGSQHFERRVATGLVMVEALLQTAADNAELVYETVENAREDFINNDDDIVITDAPVETHIDWPYIQKKDGKVVDIPITFYNTTIAKANLTRERPEAYIFSKAWHDVVDRLRAARVEVDELKADFEGEVVGLNITSAIPDTEAYEGGVRMTVTAEPITLTKKFPVGSYVVSTRQKNAAHAFNVLEPENIDSYATFNIFPVGTGDEYQVYRIFK
ncbi:Zinc carboxypeptidase [Geosmithia morbida]|uniref:Carboxypeptidase M14B n=1 Tax=Geosmithia morbida TaxID=1094350 RepID=A0A9P4YPU9_9HYPO|nr:Zinc carboxypeptidase [Geosmithia morbida]KAF4120923.1 Zinc carboxypeptidase [Geosmithia morbida]